MNDERDLNELLNRAVATLEPPTSALVGAGMARGRTRLRRRRAAQLASGVALTSLIATVAVAVWPSGNGANHGASVVPAGQSKPAGQPQPAPHPNSAKAAAKRHAQHGVTAAAITPQVIAQRTIDALLTGGTTAHLAGTYDDTYAGMSLVYDDGHGAAQIGVSLDFTGARGSAACQISICTRQPDGSTLAVYQGSDRPGQPNAEPKQWTVSLARRDGVLVTFSEWNAPEEKGAAATTRTLPPFSIKTAKQFVLADTWQIKVAQSEIDADAALFAPDNID